MCLLDPPIPYFDILVLYVRMLLVAPLFCRLLMLRPALALGASFVVYSLAQLGWLKVGHSFANVYAWQFLFAIGIMFGWFRPQVPTRRGLLALALTVVVAVVVLRTFLLLADMAWLAQHPRFQALAWAEKFRLKPLRLAYFFCVAYVGLLIARRWGSEWNGAAAKWLATVGRYSLEVFAFGVVYTYFAILASYRWDLGNGGPPVYAVLGILLSLGWAHLAAWKNRPHKATSSS